MNDHLRNSFPWKCPRCRTRHHWRWDLCEIPFVGDVIHMECDHCGRSSKMKCKLVKA